MRTTGSSGASGSTDSSACVQGCRGAVSTCSTGHVSTIRPSYITTTGSAMFQA
ncbi:hypothetical protein ACPCSD_23850 [Streptomyces griseoincarnatus]